MDLSDITVVILSRGREEKLRRTLSFWGKLPLQVLVLHNSDTPLNSDNLSSNIDYRVVKKSYGERCGEVSRILKTTYAILCADDEIYLPSALYALKVKLDLNPELSSVGGLTLAVGKYGPQITGTDSYSKMKGYQNLEPDSINRLSKHFGSRDGYLNGSIYRLLRADLMKIIMDSFAQMSHISTPYVFEVSGEIIVNAYGKSEYLNNIYWLRNWKNDQISDKNWNRRLYFNEWIDSKEYATEVSEWKSLLCTKISMISSNFEVILDQVVLVRKASEKNEIRSLERKRIRVPEHLKWLIRKIFLPNTLPVSVNRVLKSMVEGGAIYSHQEIQQGIDALA